MIVRELITLLGFKMDDSQLKSYDSKMRMVTTGIGIASAAVTALGGFALKAAGDMEQTQVAFETMMGNAAEAKKFVADMYKMGAETPYESTDLLQNAKVMMQFGLSAKQTKEDLSMLGDVGAGSAVKLQMLTLAYSQISSAGKLQGQDLLQLVNAGFNPLQEISKKTGKSMAQLREDMKDGAISADMVRDAFKSATSQGGRFYKMSEKMSKTLFGRWSTIKDNFSMMMVSVGNAFIGSFGEMMDSIANFMKVNQKLIQSGLGKFFQKLSFVFMVIYVAIKNIIQEMGGLKTIMMVTGGIVYGFIEVTLQTIKILYKLRGVILLVVTTFILYNTVIKAIAAYKFITYWIQLIQMARSFTEVLQLMNLTFITSPAFLWVAGIVAAIAVIYLLIKLI
jgi:tape measure domain-containing protein